MCDAVYLQASLDGQHITPKRRNPNEVKIPKAWAIEYKPRDRSHTLRSDSVQPDDTDHPGTETQPTVDAIFMHSGIKE